MRLINADTGKLEEFKDERILPPFAILSHTWGNSEVSLQEYQKMCSPVNQDNGLVKYNPGYLKIAALRRQAIKDRWIIRAQAKKDYSEMDARCQEAIKNRQRELDAEGHKQKNDCIANPVYVWIDTCCIDKDSSADLCEAINSMFRWYLRAQVCYAYLEDFDAGPRTSNYIDIDRLGKARWFRRGWTLQELIAPRQMEFFDKSWLSDEDREGFGTKHTLGPMLADITGIDLDVLIGRRSIYSISIARRMSWAAHRETTKVEDEAYCLLGIFGVRMTLIYGEGTDSFVRLQETILRDNADQSIFAWQPTNADASTPLLDQSDGIEYQHAVSVFAPHPRNFLPTANIRPFASWGDPPAVGNKGVGIEVPLYKVKVDFAGGRIWDRHFNYGETRRVEDLYIAPLNCFYGNDKSKHPGIVVQHITQDQFIRHPTAAIVQVDARYKGNKVRRIYIGKSGLRPKGERVSFVEHLQRGDAKFKGTPRVPRWRQTVWVC